MLQAARTAATIADGGGGVPPQAMTSHGTADLYTIPEAWDQVNVERKLPLLQRTDEIARGLDPAINKVTVNWADADSRVLIATSEGVMFTDRRPMSRLVCMVAAEKDGQRQSNMANLAGRRGIDHYTEEELQQVCREAVNRTMILFEAGRPPAGEMPVVLAAGASGILLHEAIGHGMEADFNRKGTSIYSTMIGQKVAADCVTVVDSALHEHERGALNIDDEGSPTEETVLVDRGVMRTYLHDRISAKHYGVNVDGLGTTGVVPPRAHAAHALHVHAQRPAHPGRDHRVRGPRHRRGDVHERPGPDRRGRLHLLHQERLAHRERQDHRAHQGREHHRERSRGAEEHHHGRRRHEARHGRLDLRQERAGRAGLPRHADGPRVAPDRRRRECLMSPDPRPVTADQLLNQAIQSVDAAKSLGAEDAFATVVRQRGLEFQWRDGQLEKVQEDASRSLAISLYVDGRYSSHTTHDLEPERLKTFLADAIALTRHLQPDPHRAIPDPALYEGRSKDDLDLVDTTLPDLTRKERIAWCEAMCEAASADERVVSATTTVQDDHIVLARASTNGFAGTVENTSIAYGTMVTLREGETKRPEAAWFVAGTHQEGLPTPVAVGTEALKRAVERLGSTRGDSVRTTMIVHPEAAAMLLGRMLGALAAGPIQQGQSFLAGKQGEAIASKVLDVMDDPLIPRALGSRTFDREGIAAKPLHAHSRRRPGEPLRRHLLRAQAGMGRHDRLRLQRGDPPRRQGPGRSRPGGRRTPSS